MNQDRRKHERHEIENAVAVGHEGIFQVTNISKGGICIKCPPHTAMADSWTTDILNPITPLKGFHIKVMWVSMHQNTHDHISTLMFVGAKFIKLTSSHKKKLEELINHIPSDHERTH